MSDGITYKIKFLMIHSLICVSDDNIFPLRDLLEKLVGLDQVDQEANEVILVHLVL